MTMTDDRTALAWPATPPPCPKWCDKDHDAEEPEELARLAEHGNAYRQHTAHLGDAPEDVQVVVFRHDQITTDGGTWQLLPVFFIVFPGRSASYTVRGVKELRPLLMVESVLKAGAPELIRAAAKLCGMRIPKVPQ